MNIIVKPYDSELCYCRPDTTWERENKDFYSPECVNEIRWAPVVFARISKAGKCIGEKFTERYFDGIGCGMLMYCHIDTDSSTAFTSCIDHTTILPHPLYNPAILQGQKIFTVPVNGEEKSVDLSDAMAHIKEALCNASRLTSLRIGDFVAVELDTIQTLAKRDDSQVAVKGNFCENDIFEFNIIF